MSKFDQHYPEDNSWQSIYMDLVTLLMIFFILMWVVQQGGDGAPVDTNKIIPFMKMEVGDKSFVTGKAALSKDGDNELRAKLSKQENYKALLNLGYNKKKKKYYYITVHGHVDLNGSYDAGQLSYRRANTVANVLRELIDKAKRKAKMAKNSDEVFSNADLSINDQYMISVVSHYNNFPKVKLDRNLDRNKIAQQQRPNRRVEIMYHEVPESLMNSYLLGGQ